MIYQHASGQLGNQLFEWAYAHFLSVRFDCQVVMFKDRFHSKFHSDDLFNGFPKCEHVKEFTRINSLGLSLKVLDKSGVAKRNKYSVTLDGLILRSYDGNYFPIPNKKPRLVTGYYINSRIVERVSEAIHSELSNYMEKLDSLVPTSMDYQVIHVRRGDYLTSNSPYGVLSDKYFLSQVYKNLPLVICTDDLKAVEGLADQLRPKYIFHKGNSTAWQTLQIMSRAKSLVMSNSTLSWWGGFLSVFNGGAVIKPTPFYKGLTENIDVYYSWNGFKEATADYY